MTKRYEIGEFLIDPVERVVYVQRSIGEWSYEWVPNEEIDFDTTSLIFMGGLVTFKEFFPIQTDNISSLKVIQHSIGYDNESSIVFSPSDSMVYSLWSNRSPPHKFDMSDFTHIRQSIFKRNKDGKLLFCRPYFGWEQIATPVDETSLRVVSSRDYSGAFFIDKNGLYYVNGGVQKQLESSEGRDIQPVLYERYFIYGDAAYPFGWALEHPKEPYRLNAGKLSAISSPYNQYLGDDKQLFALPSSKKTAVAPVSPVELVHRGAPPEPVSEWRFFDVVTVGGNRRGNTLYYSSQQMFAGSGSHYSLIKTPGGFYGVTGSSAELEAEKFDDVMIYNIEKEDYESIEIEQFRRLTQNYYIYKNRIYDDDFSCPVWTELDVQKLKAIRLNGISAEFYTDGTFLLGGYGLGEMKKVQRKGRTWHEWLEFKNPLFRDVDWDSLQVVSEKMMVDKINIYKVENATLQIIPINDLGLDVIIVPMVSN